jgi:hypothetical protein
MLKDQWTIQRAAEKELDELLFISNTMSSIAQDRTAPERERRIAESVANKYRILAVHGAAPSQATAQIDTLALENRIEMFGPEVGEYIFRLEVNLSEAEAARDIQIAKQAALEASVARLEDALRTVLDSAVPHPKHHPTMFPAWKMGRAVLREGQQ